ncbi:uncharacterized protein V6R79_020650 [Siganus canaliculatus]
MLCGCPGGKRSLLLEKAAFECWTSCSGLWGENSISSKRFALAVVMRSDAENRLDKQRVLDDSNLRRVPDTLARLVETQTGLGPVQRTEGSAACGREADGTSHSLRTSLLEAEGAEMKLWTESVCWATLYRQDESSQAETLMRTGRRILLISVENFV